MAKLQFNFQLRDLLTGKAIIADGGKVYVAAAGLPAKLSLTDKNGAALSNPLSLTRGSATFFVADTVSAVDLFILAPGGQFVEVKNIDPSGPNDINVDTGRRFHSFVIPFSIADTAAAAETMTGFVIPAKAEVLPIGLGVDVKTLDAGQTIDVGTKASDSGDADGFIDGLSTAAAGFKKPTLLNSGDTVGALLSVQDSANAGDDAPEGDISMQGKEISYTLDAATDTADGYIHLPYYLAA
jgi:hypothetical protein